jgi:hypothetical protein
MRAVPLNPLYSPYAAYVNRKLCYTKHAMGKKIQVTRTIDVTELGRAGGKATAANRTEKQRKAAARAAVKARWDAYYKAHPEKVKTKRSGASRKK